MHILFILIKKKFKFSIYKIFEQYKKPHFVSRISFEESSTKRLRKFGRTKVKINFIFQLPRGSLLKIKQVQM
jgi:hypothetical protein